MAITVTWQDAEPTVGSWSSESYNGTYERIEWNQQHTAYNTHSYSRVYYSIGRITGTRDFALRARVRAHIASDMSSSYQCATPRINVDDDGWKARSGAVGKTESGSAAKNWHDIGTVYAVVSGADPKVTVKCGMSEISDYVTLTSPINAPQVSINDGGNWVEADAVYIKVNGGWVEADAVHVKENGTWQEA